MGAAISYFNDIICNCVIYWCMKTFSWIKSLYRLTSWCLSYVVLERVCVFVVSVVLSSLCDPIIAIIIIILLFGFCDPIIAMIIMIFFFLAWRDV